jgi:hypothetical protein
MVAKRIDRGLSRTDPELNERIRRQTEMSLCYYRSHPDQIASRLRELDEEWDIERMLEATSSALSLFGMTWGLFRKRWWLLGLAAQGFFLQHVFQGWAPPVDLVRRCGFRTANEIETERRELLALLGERASERASSSESSREPVFQPA